MFSRLHQRRTVRQKLIDNQTVSHTENFKHPHLVTCISAPKCEPLVVIILSYQLRSISLLKWLQQSGFTQVYCASFPVILNDSLQWFVKFTWPIYLVNILSRALFTKRLLLSRRDNCFHCEPLATFARLTQEEHAILKKMAGNEALVYLSCDHSRGNLAKEKEFYSADEVYVSLLVEGDGWGIEGVVEPRGGRGGAPPFLA